VIGFLEGLEGFALRLILELYRASGLPVGEGYKPSTFYYARRGWRREDVGVYRRGLELRGGVRINRVYLDNGAGEVEADVLSESGERWYKVKLIIPLDFECNCPWSSRRFNPCKHVYATTLRVLEDAGINIEDGMLELLVYEGLNRVAYHKARTASAMV
jgi:hypothetical protein